MFSLIQLDLLDKKSVKYGRKKEGKCLHLHFWSYVSEIFVNIFERFSEKSKSKNKDMFREILKTASTRLWSTNYILKTLSNTPLANLVGNFQKLSKYQHLLFSWSNKTWQANYDYKHYKFFYNVNLWLGHLSCSLILDWGHSRLSYW